jgi:hypothetical protein
MNSLEICLWGPRNGFEIIYSDNVAYSEHLQQNAQKIDKLMENLTLDLQKEFYFLSKFDGKQVFTYVTDQNFEVGNRQTYMAVSLLAPSNYVFGAELPQVLKNLWDIYEKSNRNANGYLASNHLDLDEIRKNLSNLKASHSSYAFELSQRLIEYSKDEIPAFGQVFGKSKGDLTYFIATPIPARALVRLPSTVYSVTQLLRNVSVEEKEVRLLQQYIQNKQQFQEALRLYALRGQKLDAQHQASFSKWKMEQEPKKNTLLDLVALQRELTEEEKSWVRASISKVSVDYSSLTPMEKERLQQLIAEKKNPEILHVSSKRAIQEKIQEAKAQGWKTDPFPLEDMLSKQKDLRAELDSQDVGALREWNDGYNRFEFESCKDQLNLLFVKISNANFMDKRKHAHEWSSEVDRLKNRVGLLRETSHKNSLVAHKDYDFLVAKRWKPKNRKPLVLTLIVSTAVLLLGFGTFLVFRTASSENGDALAPAQTTRTNGRKQVNNSSPIVLYNGKTYRIKPEYSKLLTEEGIEIDSAKWRYKNKQWEKAPYLNDPNFSKNYVKDSDIYELLRRIKIPEPENTNNDRKKDGSVTKRDREPEGEGKNGDETEEPKADDEYWNKLWKNRKNLTPEEKKDARENFKNKNKNTLSTNGKNVQDDLIKYLNQEVNNN